MSIKRKLKWLSNPRHMALLQNLLRRLDQEHVSTKCTKWVRTGHSTIGQTALWLNLPSLPTAASLCVDVTCGPTEPAGPSIMSSPC